MDIALAIPSRGRVHLMPSLLKVLPARATIVVDDTDFQAYSKVVPVKQLVRRAVIPGCTSAHAKNWILDNFQEECVVLMDDDFTGVKPLVGLSKKKIVDPDNIWRIIENAASCCRDLQLGVFCWSRTMNTFLAKNNQRPFRTVQPVSSTFGVMGPARGRRLDPTAYGRADTDFTLRTLRDDRIVFTDMRFYFEHGRVFGGRGGNVGVISSEQFAEGTRQLESRWGRYVRSKKPGFRKNAYVESVSIRVRRNNPSAGNL